MTILISFFFQFQEKKKIGLHKLFFVFFLFLFHSIPCIPILILRIPTPYYMHSYPNSPHSYPDFLHSQLDSMHSHPHSPIPTLIPCIPTLITHVPTLIPCVPIISLIPFPNSPFRVLQIASKILMILFSN